MISDIVHDFAHRILIITVLPVRHALGDRPDEAVFKPLNRLLVPLPSGELGIRIFIPEMLRKGIPSKLAVRSAEVSS
ncbi:hypothetical protein ASG81_14285 [Paenibacillus sp. Soil522]|nr:hypothetical protein ASG81_14285 [Paenibacillus sp. Soil522]